MKNVILLFLLLCSFIGCKKVEKNVEIDNPTDKVVTISFNDQPEITLQPNEFKKVMIPFGDQKIIVNRGKPVEVYLDEKKNYLINPTYEVYYLEKVPFFTHPSAEKNYLNQYGFKRSKIENLEIQGDFTPLGKSLIIEKQWDFGLNEEIKSEISFRSGKVSTDQGYVIARKINRVNDIFLSIFKKAMGKRKEE
jgi:hypothetical protein